MSSLVEYAEQELTRAGLFEKDADYAGAVGPAVLELVRVFAKQGHSGMSAAYVRQIFDTVAQFKPLSPLTSDPSEWMEITHGLWQNRRRSSTFSRDYGNTWHDIDDESLNNGDTWMK